MPADETFVSFRVRGDCDPADMSVRLGLAPSQSWNAGDPVGANGRSRESSAWFLSSRTFVESDEIDAHLTWLLDRIEPRADVIGELVGTATEVDVDCTWTSVGMGGGPWIPPEAMARLAALGLPLLISFHSSSRD